MEDKYGLEEIKQKMAKEFDTEFEVSRIKEVKKEGDGDYVITNDDGWTCFLSKENNKNNFVPKVGHKITLYGGFGFVIRGMEINGELLYYRTKDQQKELHRQEVINSDNKKKEEFEREGKAKQDADYATLPEVFQRRVDKFRNNNPDFRWKYEPYELFVCKEAIKIATALKTPEAIQEFHKLPFEEQQKLVPDIDDGHSGNTFGFSCRLATLFLKDSEDVIKIHGALAPMVGSEEYGCVPKKTGTEY